MIKNNLLAILLVCSFSTMALAQETKPQEKASDQAEEKTETIASIDFSDEKQVAYVNSYAFGGYGIQGETEGKTIANDLLSIKHGMCDDGKAGKGCHSTLDASKVKLPDDTNYNYMGFACGGAIDLPQEWTATDLAGYTFSFDAKVEGTESLSNSKAMVGFVVPDDKLAKDDDSYDDVVCQLISGTEDEGELFTITDEFKTFSFDMKEKMNITTGKIEDIAKHKVKRISFSVQAQGTLEDIGADGGNRLIIDNIRLVKKK